MSQWSLSEQDKGVLRVASTEEPTWWSGPREESESFVTTLGERDGALVQLGRVGGLGKGERVYAVRFAGDTGYVVTFRQVDPLYTLDLSAPPAPAVLGELKIRGYSAYLHPLGGDLLLGIGQDASDEGRVLGHAALAVRRLQSASPGAAAHATRSAPRGPRPRATTTPSCGGGRRGWRCCRCRPTTRSRSSARSASGSAEAGSTRSGASPTARADRGGAAASRDPDPPLARRREALYTVSEPGVKATDSRLSPSGLGQVPQDTSAAPPAPSR